MALNFNFGLVVVFRDLPNDPYNKFDHDIGYPIVKRVATQDVGKYMEDINDEDTNDDNSSETYKSNHISDINNQPENADGGV